MLTVTVTIEQDGNESVLCVKGDREKAVAIADAAWMIASDGRVGYFNAPVAPPIEDVYAWRNPFESGS